MFHNNQVRASETEGRVFYVYLKLKRGTQKENTMLI